MGFSYYFYSGNFDSPRFCILWEGVGAERATECLKNMPNNRSDRKYRTVYK